MAPRTLPGIGLQSEWDLGENGWKAGMDNNLLLMSFLTNTAIEGFVANLPGAPANGLFYVVTSGPNTNSLAVRDQGGWKILAPQEGWTVFNKTDNRQYNFHDGVWENPLSGIDDAVQEAVDAAAAATQAAADTQANSGKPFASFAAAGLYNPTTKPPFIELAGYGDPGDGYGGIFYGPYPTNLGYDVRSAVQIGGTGDRWYVRGGYGDLAQGAAVPIPNYARFHAFGLTPEDFGYDLAANDAGRQAALAAWAGGSGFKKMRPNKTYKQTATITFGPTTSILDMTGAKIDATTGFAANSTAINFQGTAPGAAQQLPPLQSLGAAPGAYWLRFTDPGVWSGLRRSDLRPGDVLCIYDATAYSYSEWREYYCAGEFATVEQVAGDLVYLTGPLRGRTAYPLSTVVRRVSRWNPRIIGGEVDSRGNANIYRTMFLEWLVDSKMEGFFSQGAKNEGVAFQRCYGVGIEDARIDQFLRGSGDRYGLGIFNTQKVSVRGGTYIGGNHGIAMGGGAGFGAVPFRDIDVSGADVKAWYLAATSLHGNGEDVNFRGCQFDGGVTFGGDIVRYSDSTIRMAPGASVAAPTGAVSPFAVYTAEALGVDYSMINCRIYGMLAPPLDPNLPLIDLGAGQQYITSKTKFGGTIRLKGLTIDAPVHTRIIGVANDGSVNPDKRIDISDITIMNAMQVGRIYDVFTRSNSGTAFADVDVKDIYARGGALIVT